MYANPSPCGLETSMSITAYRENEILNYSTFSIVLLGLEGVLKQSFIHRYLYMLIRYASYLVYNYICLIKCNRVDIILRSIEIFTK